MSETELELVSRCLSGQESAYLSLWESHARRVKAYFLRSGFLYADADDLTQDVFIRAFKSLGTFDADRGSMRTWLGVIARNVARKRWDRRNEGHCFDPELADDMFAAADNPDQSVEAREENAALRDCVASLPAELAMIVRLRYVHAKTTRGVAEAAGLAESTVRLRLTEASRLLAECLKSKGIFQ